MGNKEYNKDLIIDWNKFKSKAKTSHLKKSKESYVKFCRILDEVDFELISDYIGNEKNVELAYKLDNRIKINKKPNNFKLETYKAIISFKNNTNKNGDEFIKFVGLNGQGNLITEIKTYDGGRVKLDIGNYGKFTVSRQGFYSKLKTVGGWTTDYYSGNTSKLNIYVDDIKLNTISPNAFKNQTYKAIVNFKEKLKKNDDEFLKFIGLSESGKLIAKIKTFDNGFVNLDISQYNTFAKGRQNTYNYCNSKGYRILSSYLRAIDKILIDFNCGHKPNWITPSGLKQNQGCPICNESKGEKVIRSYLENNRIEFIQEHRFSNCRHKLPLPFDFYIPDYNLCIEFDGRQHFESFDHFGGENELKITQKRDKIKNDYCKDNGINLLRIPYWELDNIEKILDEELAGLKKDLKEVV